MNEIEKTINYYDNNFENLVQRYEKANLDFIHKFFLDNINKSDEILELGFGSGRELNFLFNKGYKNLYGIDASSKFVNFVRNRFKSDNFKVSVLPDINFNKKFDFIYSIAVFMHLPTFTYEELTKNIATRLKKNGKLFISFSLGERKDDNRYFQKVDEYLLNKFFTKYNILKQEEFITYDSLDRNIKWKNIFYRKL